MSQKYYTPSASAPSLSSQTGDAEVQKETAFTAVERVVAAKGSETQTTYAECRDRIADGIDKTTSIITELKAANKQTWVVRYPTFKAPEPSEGRRPSFRHSLSFADDPTQEIPVNLNRGPGNMTRSVTLATIPDEEQTSATTDDPSSDTKDRLLPADFNVLRLDLKLGPAGSPTSAASLVSQLEKTSIANLLDERLDRALERLDKLRCRIQDTSSKVLVTGDLNAGKSTFVNALLGRDVMPVDQQPCTTMFCEVHDASENDGVEEAHVVNEGATYSRDDESTFTRVSLSNLEGVVSESDAEHVLKLYIKDTRNPSQSLLNNGVVDISLIDAPGLNRDSLGTTQLFARQEEIDVVVFVVSAENHFTLSGKEFLFNANNEKAYLFIVVNKFDHIRDKAKCKRLILEQLKHLSPRTWKEADDLVHFIDSNATSSRTASGSEATKSSVPAESWDTMEESLRSFVLVKRAKSKLMPATTYLVNILDDVELLVSANDIVAQHEFKQAQDELERTRPALDKMKQERQQFEDLLVEEEERTTAETRARVSAILEQAIERVGEGEVAVTKDLVNADFCTKQHAVPSLPPYPGFFRLWEYAQAVRMVLLESLDGAVGITEDAARSLTSAGVDRVFGLADRFLVSDTGDRPRRVFVPEAMFSRNRNRTSQAIVAGGVLGLGIGLAQRPDLIEVSLGDIFDAHRLLHRPNDDSDDVGKSSVWGLLSLGLGAVGMVGGKAIGLRGAIESLAHVGEIFGDERTRRWMVPLLAAATLGASTYIVLELPKTIPRTIGRRIKASLNPSQGDQYQWPLVAPRPSFVDDHVERITKETRKVMRIAAWDCKDRFQRVYEEKSREVKSAEDSAARTSKAMEMFRGILLKTGYAREKADLAAAN